MSEIEYARRRLSSRRGAGILSGVTLAPTNVDDALFALETVAARLHEGGDALSAFPDIYGIVTRRVAIEIRTRSGMFLEPRWISRLAGRFCQRYLETLRWSLERRPQDCDAWTAAYTCSTLPFAFPAQQVILGLSAHINFDLALGIYETIREFGHEACPEMLERYKHDHDQVNAILLASIPEAFEHLSQRHGCVVSSIIYARAYASARWVTMQVLTRWRATVWSNVRALLAARTAEERGVVIARMARRSGLYGHLFQLPSAIVSASFARPSEPEPKLAQVIPLSKATRAAAQKREAPAPRVKERLCA